MPAESSKTISSKGTTASITSTREAEDAASSEAEAGDEVEGTEAASEGTRTRARKKTNSETKEE